MKSTETLIRKIFQLKKLIMAMYHPLKIDLVMTKVKESVKLYVTFIKSNIM